MSRGTPATRRLVLAAAGALLLPRAVDAQRVKRRRIVFLNLGSRASAETYFGVLRQRLRALGYLDEDIEIEIRGADGHLERLSHLAAELVRLGPEVVIGLGPAAVQAVRQATETVPIVMVDVTDPVGLGFITSLAHPGANVTGVANLAQETVGKRLQLLKTAIPDAERIAMLVNPGNRGNILQLQATREAAGTLHMELLSVEARAAGEIDAAFVMLARGHAEALIVASDPVFFLEKTRIVELAARQKLPAIYQFREYSVIGGLMSYGPDLNDFWGRAASYVDKILNGAKPADLPVEQPNKFELVVNLKTAQVLGLTIPPSILAGADEVIE